MLNEIYSIIGYMFIYKPYRVLIPFDVITCGSYICNIYI